MDIPETLELKVAELEATERLQLCTELMRKFELEDMHLLTFFRADKYFPPNRENPMNAYLINRLMVARNNKVRALESSKPEIDIVSRLQIIGLLLKVSPSSVKGLVTYGKIYLNLQSKGIQRYHRNAPRKISES